MKHQGITNSDVARICRALIDDEILNQESDESRADAPIQARRALVDIISTALLEQARGGNESTANQERHRDQYGNFANALNLLNHPAVDASAELKEVIQHGIGDLQADIASLSQLLNELLHKAENRDIVTLLEPGTMRDRVEKEFRTEKQWIVEFLADRVFETPVRCFLQASTTIVLLADELRKREVLPQTLIHTNSTAFPYLILGKSSRYHVYTVCGQKHDAKCCGWLFDERDRIAVEHVRSLFPNGRTDDALELAVITPQFMTADGHICFEKEETLFLVEILLKEAPRLIVLSPGPRLFKSKQEVEAAYPDKDLFFMAIAAASEEQSIELIVAGELPRLNDDLNDLKSLAASIPSDCFYRPNQSSEFGRLDR